MKTKKQITLKNLAKIRDELQNTRKRIDNRIGRKADGTQQNVGERVMHPDTAVILIETADMVRKQEDKMERAIAKELKTEPLWTEWLSQVKGVGPIGACWIIGNFDIETAATVSKMWQYAGMNPGLVYGKKRVKAKDYKPHMGPIIEEIKFKEDTDYIYLTNEKIRGDRATPGFVLPYNKKLKSILIGIVATTFIKSRSPYKIMYYDTYKERLKNEQSRIYNPDEKRMRKNDGKRWQETSPGHRDSAARRYMIKMFLKDLYAAWRQIEGLPVRKPYAEEYLNRKHSNVIEMKQAARSE